MRTADINTQNPISSIKSHKKGLRFLSVFLSMLVLQLFTGCSYYRVKAIPDMQENTRVSWIKKFNQTQKYIIVHQNEKALHLNNVYLDEASLELKGTPEILAPEHIYKKEAEMNRAYRYKKKTQSPLNEAHFYLSDEVQLEVGQFVSIPLSHINRIGYGDKDVGTGIVAATGVVLGTLALLVIIIALTKDSCPFIYVDDGENLVFQGELYPGNIIKNAQKTDYLRLPAIKEVDGMYTLAITNELQEVQHTDEAVLEVVDHPAHLAVMMDPVGNVYSIADPKAPKRAVADGKYDLTEAVLARDASYAAFDTPMADSDGTRTLDLFFDHKAGDTSGKLVLRLKNTFWMDLALQKFFGQFGSYYPKYQKQQQKVSMEKAYQWRAEQHMPLSVFVDAGRGWELQQQVYAVGPMLYRDLVVPLDLEKVGDNPLKVRLKTGHQFWEIDKVAVDYSPDGELTKMALQPKEAIDNYGQEVADQLAQRDEGYYIQAEVGDRVDVRYESPPMQDEARTVFLRNTGYYIYKRTYTGKPDFAKLKQFRKPGHFTRYAEAQYHALIEALLIQEPEIVAQDEAH